MFRTRMRIGVFGLAAVVLLVLGGVLAAEWGGGMGGGRQLAAYSIVGSNMMFPEVCDSGTDAAYLQGMCDVIVAAQYEHTMCTDCFVSCTGGSAEENGELPNCECGCVLSGDGYMAPCQDYDCCSAEPDCVDCCQRVVRDDRLTCCNNDDNIVDDGNGNLLCSCIGEADPAACVTCKETFSDDLAG